jgi:hypothetical protein
MAVTMVCPNLVCAQVMRVEEELRGAKVRCCACHQVFRVPMRAEATKTLFPAGKVLPGPSNEAVPHRNLMHVTLPPLDPIMSEIRVGSVSLATNRRRAAFAIWNEVQRRRTGQS